jgi:CDP-diacylglycerol---glycerol-3-phosphate 3-phosphatidyltransferase
LRIFLGVAAAVVIANGALRAGLLLVILAALPDLFDGALAREGGHASQRGAYFDSVADRVTDMVLLGGVAWYLLGTAHPYNAIVPVAIIGSSSLISYQRAKAESLGLSAKGGIAERAERILLLCFGLLFDAILVPVLWVLLALTAVTNVQRFIKVWKQAKVAPVTAERLAARRGRRVARRTAWQHRRTELRRRRRPS